MAWKKLGVTGCLDATDVVWINEIWCPGVKDDHSSLLYNLKKPTDRKGKFEWNYKEEAITKCSEFLNDSRVKIQSLFRCLLQRKKDLLNMMIG